MIEAHPGHRDSRTSVAWFYVILILMAAIYYVFLAMDGSFNVSKPIELAARGMTFNSMLEHLLRGGLTSIRRRLPLKGSFATARPMSTLVFSRPFYACRCFPPVPSRGSTSRAYIVLSQLQSLWASSWPVWS
jgi:hypothetical protein